jgi:hypothetical protein
MSDIYVTTTGAGTNSGADWNNAYALSDLKTYLDGASSGAGDHIYMKEGTYTAVSSWSYTALNGTSINPFKIIGVKSATTNEPPLQSDWSDKTDRPLLAWTTYTFTFNDFWQFYNLNMTVNTTTGMRADTECFFYNCKVNNSNGSGIAIDCGAFNGTIIGCEAQAGNIGIDTIEATHVADCYAHDCTTGINLGFGDNHMVTNCIVDTCSGDGINVNTGVQSGVIRNCSIYNCAIGIDMDSASTIVLLSNATDNCTTGIDHASATQTACFLDYNNYNSNTSDVTNVTKGGNATANAPGYTDAANGDFSLTTGSAMREAGRPIDVGVG